jgi:hypothetical protein
MSCGDVMMVALAANKERTCEVDVIISSTSNCRAFRLSIIASS